MPLKTTQKAHLVLRIVAKACLLLASFSAFAQAPEFEEPKRPPDRELAAKIYASMDSQKLYAMIANADATRTYSEGRDDIFKVSAKVIEYKQDDWRARGAAIAIATTFRNEAGWDKMNIEVSEISNKIQLTGVVEKGIVVNDSIVLVGEFRQSLIETQAGLKEGLTATSVDLKVLARVAKATSINVSGNGSRVNDDNTILGGKALMMWNPTPRTELALKYEGQTNSKPSPDYYSPKYAQSIIVAASAAVQIQEGGWRGLSVAGTLGAGWGVTKNATFNAAKDVISEVTSSKPVYVAELSLVSSKITVSKQLNPITLALNVGYSYNGARQGTGSSYSSTSGYTGGYQKAYVSLQVSIPL